MSEDRKYQSGASQLVEAFAIFEQYSSERWITHCEHDIMYVCVDVESVSDLDKERLSELGFDPDDDVEGFSSYQHGSC